VSLRDLERNSIRDFVASCDFHGTVLDYGCGKQPYADIVEDWGALYVGYDRADFPGAVADQNQGEMFPLTKQYDAILCTQVLQYVKHPLSLLSQFRQALRSHKGRLVLTYPTNWPEVETADIHRFTKSGMEALLLDAGFVVERHVERAAIHDPWGEKFALGYGVEAKGRERNSYS
jgi:2-polyprenyl-3-methyl-5-hydroxy-6-metoxy-1,4-benzoquinol methylase